MSITVRQATLADADSVVEFNRLLALESEAKELDKTLLMPGVKAGLIDPNKSCYFLSRSTA